MLRLHRALSVGVELGGRGGSIVLIVSQIRLNEDGFVRQVFSDFLWGV